MYQAKFTYEDSTLVLFSFSKFGPAWSCGPGTHHSILSESTLVSVGHQG